MQFKKYSKTEIEEMESRAKIELGNIPESELRSVKSWWNTWFLKIGHRRLGRALLRSGITWLSENRKNSTPIKVEVDEQFEIRSDERIEGVMFSFVEHGTKKTIILNQLHPMHDSILAQVRKEITEDNSFAQPLISLLTAWAEVELSHNSTATGDHMEQMRFDISLIIKSGHVNKNVAIVQ